MREIPGRAGVALAARQGEGMRKKRRRRVEEKGSFVVACSSSPLLSSAGHERGPRQTGWTPFSFQISVSCMYTLKKQI
jgi:hypothetical protein